MPLEGWCPKGSVSTLPWPSMEGAHAPHMRESPPAGSRALRLKVDRGLPKMLQYGQAG